MFEVSPQALTVPDINSYNGLMHTLFTLEDLYGLKITELNGKVYLHLDKGMGTNYITMFEMFSAWKEQAEKYKNGEITKEEYDHWRYNYPKYDETFSYVKLPSQQLSVQWRKCSIIS